MLNSSCGACNPITPNLVLSWQTKSKLWACKPMASVATGISYAIVIHAMAGAMAYALAYAMAYAMASWHMLIARTSM